MTSFENQIQKLIRHELLRCLEQLIPEKDEKFFQRDTRTTIDIAVDPVDRPQDTSVAEPSSPDDQKAVDAKKAKAQADEKVEVVALKGPDFLLAAEFNAMHVCIRDGRTLTPSDLFTVRAAYAKTIAIAHVSNSKILERPWYMRLGDLLSLYERDGTLKTRSSGLFYVAILMDSLKRELPANKKRIKDRVFVLSHGPQIDQILDKLYQLADNIKTKAKKISDCDTDELSKQMTKLRSLLCELQEQYQHLLCLEKEAINWPGTQEVMIPILRASIGKLGEFIATAWIVFREIECIDDCDCNCTDLRDAWNTIGEQINQLRKDLDDYCGGLVGTTGQACASTTDAVVAIAATGAKLSAGQHDCQVGCSDRQAQHDLIVSLQVEMRLLEGKINKLQPRLHTIAFDLIWPEVATILYCIDPCDTERDECDELREKLGCIVESWNAISGQAKPAKIGAGKMHTSCCNSHAVHCSESNFPSCTPEVTAEITRAEKMLLAAPSAMKANIDLGLKQLKAAKDNGNSEAGRKLLEITKAKLDSMEIAGSWKIKSAAHSPTHGHIACGCEA